MSCGIVVALPQELPTLVVAKLLPGQFATVNENLLVACSGAGETQARQAAEQLLQHGATRLLSWGCAAALVADLKPGDLVIPNFVLDGHQRFATHSLWLAQVNRVLGKHRLIYHENLFSSSKIVASSQEKRQIHQQTQAIALDMESAAIAEVAAQHGLPCLVIRAIADPMYMDLPAAVVGSLNAQGDVALFKLLTSILAQPSQIPELIALGSYFGKAKKTLKTIAKQLEQISQF